MRESCSCGASIHSLHYSRVKDWRSGHQHDVDDEVAPDKNGSEAHTERAPQFDHEAQKPISARIGFSMDVNDDE